MKRKERMANSGLKTLRAIIGNVIEEQEGKRTADALTEKEAQRREQVMREALRPVRRRRGPKKPRRRRIIKYGRHRVCEHFWYDDDPASVLQSGAKGKNAIIQGVWSSGSLRRAVLKLGTVEDRALLAEQYYFTFVVPEIRKRSPHIVRAFVPRCVLSDKEALGPLLREAVERSQIMGIVLQLAPGKTLWNVLQTLRPRLSALMQEELDVQVTVQIASLLDVMATLRFGHNDLHTQNIVLQRLHKPFLLTHLPTRFYVAWFARVIDIGNSSTADPTLAPNPHLPGERCDKYGACGYQANWDWFRFQADYKFARDWRGEAEDSQRYFREVLACKPFWTHLHGCQIDRPHLKRMETPGKYLERTLTDMDPIMQEARCRALITASENIALP